MTTPGQHIVIVGTELDALAARSNGLHLRDSLLILAPGPITLTAYLFRTPIDGTITDNTLKYNHGALNINATRVSGYVPECTGQGFKTGKFTGNAGIGDTTLDGLPWKNTEGRWPTNLVLIHCPTCQRTGTKTVSVTPSRWKHYPDTPKTSGQTYAQDAWTKEHFMTSGVTHDKDGTETVPAYTCDPKCPVQWLDRLSGHLVSKWGTQQTKHDGDKSLFGLAVPNDVNRFSGDAGGASRFFPQFNSLAEALQWLYTLVSPPPPPSEP